MRVARLRAVAIANFGSEPEVRLLPALAPIRPTVAVHNIAAAVGTSTVMVPPTVTQNKHRNRRHSRRRPVSGDGSGPGIVARNWKP
jgi:hypothetical protein